VLNASTTIGKTADLAFGYAGGVGAWRKLAPDDGSTDEQITRRQYAWRASHPQTRDYWTALNTRAILAVRTPCEPVKFQRPGWRHLSFKSDGVFLRIVLPSGRAIAYPFPQLQTDAHKKPVVVFMDNALGKWAECRFGQGAYGGLWMENAVQATARDLFAAAMPRLEAAGYEIVLHIHASQPSVPCRPSNGTRTRGYDETASSNRRTPKQRIFPTTPGGTETETVPPVGYEGD
jgi:DNA polymerase